MERLTNDLGRDMLVVFWLFCSLLLGVAVYLTLSGDWPFGLALSFGAVIILCPTIGSTVVALREYLARHRRARTPVIRIAIGGEPQARHKRAQSSGVKPVRQGVVTPVVQSTVQPTRGQILRELGITIGKVERVRDPLAVLPAVPADSGTYNSSYLRTYPKTVALIEQVRYHGRVRVKANAKIGSHHGDKLRKVFEKDMYRMGVDDIAIMRDGKDLVLTKK